MCVLIPTIRNNSSIVVTSIVFHPGHHCCQLIWVDCTPKSAYMQRGLDKAKQDVVVQVQEGFCNV